MWAIDLFRDAERIQDEVNELLSMVAPSVGRGPALNAWKTTDGFTLTTDLPGVSPNDLDVSVAGDTLTIKGSRAAKELKEGENWIRRERGFGEFSRSVRVPFKIDASKVDAQLSNGVLTVRLSKAADQEPQKIEIKGRS